MLIDVIVDDKKNNKSNFAQVRLDVKELKKTYYLDLGFKPFLEKLSNINSKIALDFLFISSIIYISDKIILRKFSKDNWTRDLKINIPVYNKRQWNLLKKELENIISFLTGDIWKIDFFDLKIDLIRSIKKYKQIDIDSLGDKPKIVSFLSGGLDSYIHAINWLESNKGNIFLVSHYDGSYSGVKSDQIKLLSHLKKYYPDRIVSCQSLIWQRNDQVKTSQKDEVKFENSQRGRSLLFIAMGILAANSIGDNVPVIIPENGNISLNYPLTPSRNGSCSTRTVHPYFISLINQLLKKLGFENRVSNPFEFQTKGEIVENCKNTKILKNTFKDSTSCAKRGHKINWKNRNAKQCGSCIPCIFRRVSLNKINLDLEDYGNDICIGDIDPKSRRESSFDLRAVIDVLNNNPSMNEIESKLIANGKLDIMKLSKYSELVFKAFKEVQKFFKTKASEEIMREIKIN